MKEIICEFNKMPSDKTRELILINIADHINYSKTKKYFRSVNAKYSPDYIFCISPREYFKGRRFRLYNCCIVKGIEGCWECNIAPCDIGMFSESHDVRLRAFIKYIKENGKDKLAERLYSNMQKGIFYGHGKDYDNLGSIEAVLHKLEGQ